MSARSRYATPAAFRRALTDRLKDAAKGGRWTLQQLQRQVAYDRLIERLYLAGATPRTRSLTKPAPHAQATRRSHHPATRAPAVTLK